MPLTLIGRVAFAVVLGLHALVSSTRLRAEWCSTYASWCHDCIDGAARCCLYREGSGGTYCAHVGAVSNSGMLSCWRRTMASVPFLSRGAGDFCKNVSGMQRSVQSSSARCQCSVDANWRLSVWPLCRRCCYQLVLVPSLPWCCYIRCASIMALVYRLRGGKSCLAGAREALVMVWLVCTSA
jgi:hypothetical protein